MRRLLSAFVFLLIVSPLAHAQKQFGFDNKKSSGQPYLSPEETVKRMQVADGFEVKLFAGEPQLVNPIAMTVDEKGRVWVVECFEYPKRTEKGKMPRDRIVILEDTDGDGVCDKRTVFAEGKDFPVPFDMASGIEVGYGGVYVGAPPYLFHIENKNDKPGKFEILLKGFGSQDTHETLNTFQWGPDGWLYGLHGIYTQSEVVPYGAVKEGKDEPGAQATGPNAPATGIKLNAAVWRFHPKTKKFEIFSEGTSNPWGMDWRNTDGQFILCCCVIPHLYHMVPGGIYRRQGGQGFNPYAYGEIKEICDHTFHKESGWAHAGLISLDTPLMPEKYRNSVIFGSIHGCSLKQNILKPNGSTYTASRGDDFLVSGDKNFRPINLRWGPNGEIYCIDWHDQNPCHQAAHDSWDYERGRVYRIQPKGLKTNKAENLSMLRFGELVKNVTNPNPYISRTSLRIIRERPEKIDELEMNRLMFDMEKADKNWRETFHHALLGSATIDKDLFGRIDIEGIGIDLAVMPKLQKALLIRALPQLVEDRKKLIKGLQSIAQLGPDVAMQRELLSAAVKLADQEDVSTLLHIIWLSCNDKASDPVIPHLFWFAFEKQLMKSKVEELRWLLRAADDNPFALQFLIPRMMRRMVATGKAEDLSFCVAFVGIFDDSKCRLHALEGLVEALKNRQVDAPPEWKVVRNSLMKENKEIQALTMKLAINFRDADAIKKSLAVASDVAKSVQERVEAVRDLGLATPQAAINPLLTIAKSDKSDELRVEALRALGSFNDSAIAKELLAIYESLPRNLKAEAVNLLASRKDSAKALLEAVAANKVARTDLSDNTILRIQSLKDKNLDAQVEKVWGRLRATPAELNDLINKTRNQLGEARASFDRGKLVFDNHCAKCHKFEGRGFEVGPNIEGAERSVEYLLTNVLDPNRVIGAPYFIRTVTTLSGKNEIGILAAEDDQSITLKTENGVLKVIPKREIEETRIQEKSLMPEGFGSNMKVQEFRDLIRYVMANPFITEVDVNGKSPLVGVAGRIPLGDDEQVRVRATVTSPEGLKTKLLIGSREDFEVRLNGKSLKGRGAGAPAQPDQATVDVELHKGENTIELLVTQKAKGDAVYLRFHDPDRKLRYPEPKD